MYLSHLLVCHLIFAPLLFFFRFFFFFNDTAPTEIYTLSLHDALPIYGVMVPFRPEGGPPQGKTAWHEIKVGVLARLRRHTTRTGKVVARLHQRRLVAVFGDRKSTRLNSSHGYISYAVFCLKKKKTTDS